jgi:hypothetical protein
MTIGSLNGKGLYVALGGMLLLVIVRYAFFEGGTAVVAPVESVPMAEKRLEDLRRKAATVPGKEAVLKQRMAELEIREKGLIKGDTAAQVQAHLLDLVQHTATAEGFDARGTETPPQPKLLGKDYGEVTVAKSFTCGIDQLVNFLAAIGDQPELVATTEIHIAGTQDKKKNLRVRLVLSGVVTKKLIPEKKGLASF